MNRAGGRIHGLAARHTFVRDAAIAGAGQTGTAFGTQVGAIEGTARRASKGNILAGFAVIDLVVSLGCTGEDQTNSEERGED